MDSSKSIITNIGQLNFFKWAINNKIIQYVKDNLTDIKANIKKKDKEKKLFKLNKLLISSTTSSYSCSSITSSEDDGLSSDRL